MVLGPAKTRLPTDHAEWESGHGENNGVAVNSKIKTCWNVTKYKMYGRNHPQGSPGAILITINALPCHHASVDFKPPPVPWTDGDVASGPEEQRSVGEE